jgi:hypothetical protein
MVLSSTCSPVSYGRVAGMLSAAGLTKCLTRISINDRVPKTPIEDRALADEDFLRPQVV